MQRKINFVIGCIITFLVVMDVLQIRWLYGNYQDRKNQYLQILNNVMEQATDQYQALYNNLSLNDSVTYYMVSSSDNRLRHKSSVKPGKKNIAFYSETIILDSVTGRILNQGRLLSMPEPEFKLAVFDSLFRTALEKNKIYSPYKLDTIRKPAVFAASTGTHAIQNNHIQHHDDYLNITVPVLVNTEGSLHVAASVKQYPAFLFGRFLWAFVINLVIFISSNLVMLYVLKTIRKQKKLNEIKNDFINNMTHELRTPITVAATAIDAILHHHGLHDVEKARFYLETSRSQLLHLDQLVEKILNIAIEDRKNLALRYEKLNIKDVVTTILQNTLLTAGKQVDFSFNPKEADIVIRADKMHLANALNNLIDNAIKYSGDPVHVHISCSRIDKQLTLVIKDNGTGIAKEYQSRIFEPFFRVPQGNLHDVKGFGLGLSYVKTVIEKHRGTIEVISSLHGGTTFTITLPIDRQYE